MLSYTFDWVMGYATLLDAALWEAHICFEFSFPHDRVFVLFHDIRGSNHWHEVLRSLQEKSDGSTPVSLTAISYPDLALQSLPYLLSRQDRTRA